jgi:hypothetical protein
LSTPAISPSTAPCHLSPHDLRQRNTKQHFDW